MEIKSLRSVPALEIYIVNNINATCVIKYVLLIPYEEHLLKYAYGQDLNYLLQKNYEVFKNFHERFLKIKFTI